MSKISTMYANLMTAVDANTTFGLAKILAPIVRQAIVHGQVRIRDLNNIRKLQDPKLRTLKSALGKTMPISWNKENNTYVFSKQKVVKLQENINIDSIHTVQESILDILEPKRTQDETVEQTPKKVNAWSDAQLSRQVERLDEMDADALQAHIKQLEKLLNSANDRMRGKVGDFLKVVGSHDHH